MRKTALPVLLFAALLAACPSTAAEDAGKALFESKCSACHDYKRVDTLSTNRAGWEKLVERMKKRAAGAISDSDAAAIVEYLVRAYPAAK